MDDRDLLFYVEMVFFYGGLMAFALWEVIKMRRHAKKREAEKRASRDRPDTSA